MFAKIRQFGLWFASLKGMAYAMSLIPTVAAFVSGVLEQRPWSEIILIVVGTLALGLAAVYYAISIGERAKNYFVSRAEQRQIAERLSEYINGEMVEIDTPTAAAIWAGTREEGSIERHVKFRRIKSAIANGRITNTQQRNPTGHTARGPNVHTWMPVSEFRNYLISIGVIRESDLI